MSANREALILKEFHHLQSLVQGTSGDELIKHKQQLVALFPRIKQLAHNGNAQAKYYIALMLPHDSKKHFSLLLDAYSQGSLDAAYELVQTHRQALSDSQIIGCLKLLLDGNDDYLHDEAQSFLEANPQYQHAIVKAATYKQAAGMLFFRPQGTSQSEQDVEHKFQHATTNSG